MSTSRLSPSRRRGAALAAACLLSLAACGGGNDDVANPTGRTTAGEAARAVASIRLEGCVVDEYFIPRTGTTVRLLSADGRLLGHASSDKDGIFTLQVPAQQTVSVTIDKAGGEALVVPTGRTNLSVGACLRDPHA